MSETQARPAKADLDHIYDQPDPTRYFSTLKHFDYKIPGLAKNTFVKLLDHLKRTRESQPQVLDLGCSYGINAALLKYDLEMDDLYARWGLGEASDPQAVIARDREFFQSADARPIRMIGLDAADNAIGFATNVGLLDTAIASNLEEERLTSDSAQELVDTDLVISTGCVGYVTEKSFAQFLPPLGSPWFANFVLRMFPFDPIEQKLAEHGFVTQKLEDVSFVQREFVDEEEQLGVCELLERQNIDPSGKEANGELHAELFVSAPKKETSKPLEALSIG